MRRNGMRRADLCAALMVASWLACVPASHPAAAARPAHVASAAACEGGWQLRTSVKECALRAAAAALAGAVLPLPFAVPVSVGLALGAVFTCL